MTLPYDIARCAGTTKQVCQGCRRKEPGNPYRQSFMSPAVESDGTCAHRIDTPPVAGMEMEKGRVSTR